MKRPYKSLRYTEAVGTQKSLSPLVVPDSVMARIQAKEAGNSKVVAIPEAQYQAAQAAEADTMNSTNTTGYLAAILTSMTTMVRYRRGKDNKLEHFFKHTASVIMYLTEDNVFHLAVWRQEAMPDASEWDTFIRYLPEAFRPAQPVTAKEFKHGEKLVRSAEWPVTLPEESDD